MTPTVDPNSELLISLSAEKKGRKHWCNRFREARGGDQSNAEDLPHTEGFIGKEGSTDDTRTDLGHKKDTCGTGIEFRGSPRRCEINRFQYQESDWQDPDCYFKYCIDRLGSNVWVSNVGNNDRKHGTPVKPCCSDIQSLVTRVASRDRCAYVVDLALYPVESTAFTRQGSLVQIQPRPPFSTAFRPVPLAPSYSKFVVC